MKKILAICRDKIAFYSILNFKGISYNKLIIASDDLEVHERANDFKLHVTFLTQIKSFFDIAPEVLSILNSVNRWLYRQGNGRFINSDLLYWVQHVEGGIYTQRIQDAILEACSYFFIFKKLNPSKIIIGASTKFYWQDEVLIACAKKENIQIYRIKRFNLVRSVDKIWQYFLYPFVKELYRCFRAILSIIHHKKSGLPNKNYLGKYIAIQLCSSLPKHLNHTIPLFKAFKKVGLRPVIITWNSGNIPKLLRNHGYEVVELEAWIPPSFFVNSWRAIFIGLFRAKTNQFDFLSDGKGGRYSSLIRSSLWLSVWSFFISEVPYRMRLDIACRNFFKYNPPIAARLWTRTLEEGTIAFKAMQNIGVYPLLFWQPGWPYQLPNPYLRYYIPTDLTFCISDAHRKTLNAQKDYHGKIFVSGFWLHNNLKRISNPKAKSFSRSLFGIGPKVKLVVFCDAQAILPGYCSRMEQVLIVKTVIEFAEKHEDVFILIKPHPSHKSGQIEKFFKRSGKSRIKWLDAKILPYDGLNAADVIITKFSTLVIEGMILDVPSICVLLDGDMRWAIYENAVEYVTTTSDLKNMLENLRDPFFYSIWKNKMRKKQQAYLEYHLPKLKTDCNEFIANKIKFVLENIRH